MAEQGLNPVTVHLPRRYPSLDDELGWEQDLPMRSGGQESWVLLGMQHSPANRQARHRSPDGEVSARGALSSTHNYSILNDSRPFRLMFCKLEESLT